jgi:transposase InsO family protein
MDLGEPLRAPFGRARVGLSAPSPTYSPLRAECVGGSASIPLAGYRRALRASGSKYAGIKYKILRFAYAFGVRILLRAGKRIKCRWGSMRIVALRCYKYVAPLGLKSTKFTVKI